MDEAVDNDAYDDDQGGFIIGSLGAFCAVTSDQSEELYIDKSDLIIDDDCSTNGEDEYASIITNNVLYVVQNSQCWQDISADSSRRR